MNNSRQLPGAVTGHENAVTPSTAAPPPLQPAYAEFSRPGASDDLAGPELIEYWRALLRHKTIVVFGALLGALLAFFYSVRQTPIYKAQANLEIRGFNEKLMNMSDFNPALTGGGGYSETYVNTLVELLGSKSLVERVVLKLNLHQQPERPQDEAVNNDSTSTWKEFLGLPQSEPLTPLEAATNVARGSLEIKPATGAHIVRILYDSPDPNLAADFVNTLTEEFIEQTLEVRWNSGQRTAHWLTQQLADLKTALRISQEKLQAYAAETGLMFTSQDELQPESVTEQKLKQLQQSLTAAQAQRMAVQSQYEMAISSPPDSLPAVLDNGPITQYQVRLADLTRELADLSSELTPAHYKVQQVQAQIAEVKSTLRKERDNIVARIKNEYETARRHEALLQRDYEEQAKLVSDHARKAIHYSILKGEVETNRQLYQTMLQQVKESSFAAALQATNIRVVDAAFPPKAPYKPKLLLNVSIGLLAGLMLSTVIVLARQSVDRSIKSPGEAPLYLNVPEFGSIPTAHRLSQGTLDLAALPVNLGNGGTPALTQPQGAKRKKCVELATWQHKPSIVAESFRAALASILFSTENGKSPQVIVFTSCNPSEGKTTTVTNLGIALTEISRRVLLVDCDLRKPKLATIFGFGRSRGVGELLRDKRPMEECTPHALVHTTEIPGLYVLPAGMPETTSVSNLFYSNRMAQLVQLFRRDFDAVLIDCPPMLQMSDARVIARLSDGVILVLRAGKTTRDTALAARQRLAEDHTTVLGTILNHWDPRSMGYYGSYGSYYYNNYKSYSS